MATVSTSIWHISHFELTLRVLVSLLLGGLVGMEREWSNHAAGFRTHILVCLGSTTIMLLSIYGFGEFAGEPNVRMDPARLAAQVISGIGFLGAGAIMRTGATVSGLTTAASVWVVAAIGLCVGAGFYYGAVVVTFLVLVSLFFLNKWEKRLLGRRKRQEMLVRIGADRPGILGQVTARLQQSGIRIASVKIESGKDSSAQTQTTLFHFRLQKPELVQLTEAIEQIYAIDEVMLVELPGVAAGSLAKVTMKEGKYVV
ncbi:MgtC/SapB family protein [Gordoniibacillus kamchatkensis]|uniref:MgtC/SapB family protein n=1 Tax=Gordoniibacillus kamchatkensis TaxID=1590651 RepID=UPI000AC43B0B|nr:MgtC/SapB family protein [Paenibacillus sp. VKM B-2647]